MSKKPSSLRRNRIAANTAVYVLLTVMSIVWLVPFFCILMQSFRCESTWMVGYILPQKWGLDNYIYLFTHKVSENNALPDFVQWYLNTLIVALANAVCQTIMVTLMSYGLSRLRFKGRKLLMNAMLVLGMFPGFLSMIILYYILKSLGLTQSGAVPGLILVYAASSGMGYYVFKGFLDTIPKSLDEAARCDGATRFQVLYKVILPLSKPIVIYTVLTAFMAPWADYIFASYIAFGTSSGYNVAVGLYSWLTKDMINNNFTAFCAGGVCIAVPITILFMCLQKYYVEGVTGGAVKG
ncbi:MAG: sugar ABC transporter permease [Firmicutes bacterium]|nr:sugar ABC transporter permease [Bacillota bacterium]